MTDHPIAYVAVAMLFAAMASAADRSDSSDGRDPAVREAQAAKLEEQQGRLKNNADRDQREQNRYARCDYLQGDDREYCIRRMNGEGTVSGSVESGGITRELRVPVPAR
jgi:hypothetical protein